MVGQTVVVVVGNKMLTFNCSYAPHNEMSSIIIGNEIFVHKSVMLLFNYYLQLKAIYTFIFGHGLSK